MLENMVAGDGVTPRPPAFFSPVIYNQSLLASGNVRALLSRMEKTILVTGGSGFIGCNFILQWIEQERTPVVNVDKLTYAGNQHNLLRIASDPRYCFV